MADIEVRRARTEEVAEFLRATEREALKSLYDFNVIWHEQTYEVAAYDAGTVVGVAKVRIAASLAHVEWIVVAPDQRRSGIGKALLAEAGDLGNYYNCHKMTVMVPHTSTAQAFFEACDYKVEAILPQHTFKLDVAVLRKFLL